MSSWLKAMNPSTPITTEAEAERAARVSAISIFIGVVVGLISIAWTLANPQVMQDAMAQAGGATMSEAQIAGMAQFSLYSSIFFTVAQVIFGLVQWRNPGKFIAILFIVLIALTLVLTLAGLLTASLAGTPSPTPAWQIALSVVIMIVQVVLHVTGLKGIKALDRIQMEQAR